MVLLKLAIERGVHMEGFASPTNSIANLKMNHQRPKEYVR